MTYKELDIQEYLDLKETQNKSHEQLAEYYGVNEKTSRNWYKKIKEQIQLDEDDQYITGRSTLRDSDGNLVMEWTKTNKKVKKESEAIKDAIKEMIKSLEGKYQPKDKPLYLYDELVNLYISNDIHIGALHWSAETRDRPWDIKIAERTIDSAYEYLMNSSPKTKVGVVVDLGDLTEQDDFTNSTPKSKNILHVDGRYTKVLKSAYMCLIRGIERALEHHEIVYFINIAGNHDITTGHAIREIVTAWFRNEPRVIVDEDPTNIKYFRHGNTLLQFAHGDEMQMRAAGEVMFHDQKSIIGEIDFCYSHFGHYHKDIVHDGRLTRAESHRNLASLNERAAGRGYRRGIGTMKSITYSLDNGEISRNLFNVSMLDEN